jgi:hypothetical protein
MPKALSSAEDRILEACEAAKRVKKPNISALAREFDVSYYQLRNRIHGRIARNSRTPTHKTLDNSQEKAVIRWIRLLDNLHAPPTIRMIEQCANQILRRNWDENAGDAPRVSHNWAYRFTQRLPSEFQLIKQRPIDKKRLQSEDISLLTAWFERLEPYVARILPKNIYNFDESGFQLGQGKPQNVVTTHPERAARGNSTSEISESLTVIECITADGFVIPPYFVFKGEYHLERWYQSADLPDDYRIATSPKGFTSDQLAFDWIQHFHTHTKDRVKKGEQRLLLMDGHGSHLTYDFIQFCEQLSIVPFCFIPHTTHITQPLDGQPFQVYKHYFRSQNNQTLQWGGSVTDKADFLRDIPQIRMQTFKQRTIRSAFADRGIYPYNPQKVIQPLLDQKSPTPELQIWDGNTPPPASSSTNSPPHTIRTLRRSINKAQNVLQASSELNQSLIRRLDRIFQSSIENAELAAQTQADIAQHIQPKLPRNAHKSRRRIPAIGPLSVKDANRRIADRTERERQQAIRRAKKLPVPQLNQATPERLGEGSAIPEESQLPTEQSQLFFYD